MGANYGKFCHNFSKCKISLIKKYRQPCKFFIYPATNCLNKASANGKGFYSIDQYKPRPHLQSM